MAEAHGVAGAIASKLPGATTPLGRTVAESATDIWTDSCAVDDLEYALGFGAVGATANPTIVMDAWRRDSATWREAVRRLAAENEGATEVELAWGAIEAAAVPAARLLQPVFARSGGRLGRLSIQVDPTLFASTALMVEQAARLDRLAANIIVKLPATRAGIEAMAEASRCGISVNATVSFTVAQAIAAAEAIETGIREREAAGLPTEAMGPVVTLMMGRLEDWLRVVADREGLIVDPDAIGWAGVAVVKRAQAVFAERGYRARLLGAAIRHHRHWSELIGGDLAITIPPAWQRRFNASDIEVRPRFDDPVEPAVLDELRRRFPDFRRAEDPAGLTSADFDAFGPTRRTLRAFVASWHDLLHEVSDVRIPDPDADPASGR